MSAVARGFEGGVAGRVKRKGMKKFESLIQSLHNFKKKGEFTFQENDSLREVCNIPNENNYSGIYLFFNSKNNELIYIGISGREAKDGSIIHRKDGLRGRFLKGKQFGDFRPKTLSIQMQKENIQSLRIEWFVTCGFLETVIPRHLEKELLERHLFEKRRLPSWNKII